MQMCTSLSLNYIESKMQLNDQASKNPGPKRRNKLFLQNLAYTHINKQIKISFIFSLLFSVRVPFVCLRSFRALRGMEREKLGSWCSIFDDKESFVLILKIERFLSPFLEKSLSFQLFLFQNTGRKCEKVMAFFAITDHLWRFVEIIPKIFAHWLEEKPVGERKVFRICLFLFCLEKWRLVCLKTKERFKFFFESPGEILGFCLKSFSIISLLYLEDQKTEKQLGFCLESGA